MAVESHRATPGTWRYLLWGTAATLGISGAAAALINGLSAYLVYQYARARGQWGTDEPPAGSAEEVTFTSTGGGRTPSLRPASLSFSAACNPAIVLSSAPIL